MNTAFKHFLKRFIDYLFRKKSLLSCLFLTLGFFLSQLASIGQSEEIIKYCNRIQERNPDNLKYDLAQIFKILYADGNTVALIISGIMVIVFVTLIFIKKRRAESEIDFAQAYKDVRDGKIDVKIKSFKDLPKLP